MRISVYADYGYRIFMDYRILFDEYLILFEYFGKRASK